jgi:hypothetical protein
VTFDEDRSRIRKRNGAGIMSSLRNLVISIIRLDGRFRYIPTAIRYFSMHIDEAMAIIGV